MIRCLNWITEPDVAMFDDSHLLNQLASQVLRQFTRLEIYRPYTDLSYV